MANIVWVDENDTVIGAGSMQEAFARGIKHRISRVFLSNSKGELLIAKRSMQMRSSPGKWGESAAGHVDEGEEYLQAAIRETEEEIGVKGVSLREVGKFYYESTDEAGGIRNRFNMVYVGTYDGPVMPDAHEVSEVRWVAPTELGRLMKETPDDFTTGVLKAFRFL